MRWTYRLATFLVVWACSAAGCGRRESRERPPGLQLTYQAEFPRAPDGATSRKAKATREQALWGLEGALEERLAAAGYRQAELTLSYAKEQIFVYVPTTDRVAAVRVKELAAPAPLLELRLVSTESYVDEAFRAFLAADPRRAEALRVVGNAQDARVVALAASPDDQRTSLVEALRAWRESPLVANDAVRSALWSRVRTGQATEPQSPAADSEKRETRWRTYLLEPDVALPGELVAGADVKLDPDSLDDQIVVLLTLNAEGTTRLAEVTGQDVGRTLTVVVDDAVRFAGRIAEPITGGTIRLGFGEDSPGERMARADALCRLITACTMGARLGLPPLAETWTGP